MPTMPETLRHTLLAALILLAAGCRKEVPVSGQFIYGSVTATVTVAARDAGQIQAVMDATRSTSMRVLRSLDANDSKSDISRLNKIAATSRWPVPQDTFRALDLALHYGEQTDGAFDITTGPLASMWGLPNGPAPREAPLPEILEVARQGAGLDQVRLTDDGAIAFLSPLTRLDLGEMTPAYALDMSLVNIRRRGITNTLARFNGSLRALGAEETGKPWREPVFHPSRPAQLLGHWVFKQPGALATCLLYARSVTIAGQRHGGVIDPAHRCARDEHPGRRGQRPHRHPGQRAGPGHGVLGAEGATNILARFPRYECLIVSAREPLEVWVTEGFRRQFEPDPAVAGALKVLVAAALPPPEPEEVQPAEETSEAGARQFLLSRPRDDQHQAGPLRADHLRGHRPDIVHRHPPQALHHFVGSHDPVVAQQLLPHPAQTAGGGLQTQPHLPDRIVPGPLQFRRCGSRAASRPSSRTISRIAAGARRVSSPASTPKNPVSSNRCTWLATE
jgi:thiamine biosynthesis lipoprotein